MKSIVILVLGMIGSIIMAGMDYAGTIDVANWCNLIPLGISLLVLLLIHGGHHLVDFVVDIFEIFT